MSVFPPWALWVHFTRVDTMPRAVDRRPSEHMVASLPVWKGIEQTGFPKIMTSEAEQCDGQLALKEKLERIFQTEGNAVVSVFEGQKPKDSFLNLCGCKFLGKNLKLVQTPR